MGEKSTPAKTPSSTGKQQSILGFFSKVSTQPKSTGATSTPSKTTSALKGDKKSSCLKETTKSNSLSFSKRSLNFTPVPSSDVVEPLSSQENLDSMVLDTKLTSDPFLAPSSPADLDDKAAVPAFVLPSSPIRKVCLAFHLSHAFVAGSSLTSPHLPGQEGRQLRRDVRRRRRSDNHAASGASGAK